MIKKLLGQTALYGISSVLVRIFPFLIAPIITRAFSPAESAPFVDWYSIAGVVTVFLTHGMETSFFRFAQEKDISKETLVSTCSMSILAMSFYLFGLGMGVSARDYGIFPYARPSAFLDFIFYSSFPSMLFLRFLRLFFV